ncbi:hypothetical protein FRC01_014128 [Tulasnella sp. 417]|nr:hypothetical protein FRC01_014128 [Tulasnella sp. 417]
MPSQQASLDLYWSWQVQPRTLLSSAAELPQGQREFWEMVSSHRRRWRSVDLELIAPLDGSAVPNLEINPMLEHLSLSFTRQLWPVDEPLELFAEPKPHLRHLSLITVPIRWSTFSAPKLSVLRLFGLEESLGPSLLQLYDILEACPNLEELAVESIASLARSQPLDPPHLVELHRLAKLLLKHIEARAVKWLLDGLRMPSDCSVLLFGLVHGDPKDSLFPDYLTDLPEKCLSRASKITVVVLTASVRLWLDGLWTLNLTLDDMDVVREVLLWLDVAEVSPKTENLPIEMEWRSTLPLNDGFFDPVSGFENVRRITIHSNFGARHQAGDKNGAILSFPGLQELRIEDPTNQIVEMVIALVNKRQAAIKNDTSRDSLRMVVFDGSLSGKVDHETFWGLLYAAKARDLQVWWDGRCVFEGGTQNSVAG